MSHLLAICADFKSMSLTQLGAIGWPTRGEITPFLQLLKAQFSLSECFFLQSCNRREFYFYLDEGSVGPQEFVPAFFDLLGSSLGQVLDSNQFQVFVDDDAVGRLFRVAASLESMVLGETEIMKQIKDQFRDALACGNSGRLLRTLVEAALRAAKRVRSETHLTRHVTSMASLIQRAALNYLGGRRGRIVFVGAGHFMESLLPPFAKLNHCHFTFVNRTLPEALASRYGGEARRLVDFLAEPGEFDVLISATSSAVPLFSADWVHAHKGTGTVLLVDGALPQDITTEATRLPGVCYLGLAQMEDQLYQNRERREAEIPKAEPIFDEELALLKERWRELALNPLHSGVAEYYQQTADRALAALFKQADGLNEEQRAVLSNYSRYLVQRLVSVPVLGLKGVARELGDAGVNAWKRGVSSGSPLFWAQACS